MKIKYLLFALIILTFYTCVKPPDYSIEPKIEFIGLSKNTMRQGEFGREDSLYLFFSFTDGDGDLGGVGKDKDSLNISIIDKRTNQLSERFRIPQIPEQGAGNGISGEIRVLLYTTCCNVLPSCSPSTKKPIDTLSYDIFIKDRAGNKSNVVQTSPILLQCK
jgi:hypothetical protein